VADYTREPVMPFFLWLRTLVGQKLLAQYRLHLGAAARDAGREIRLYHGAMAETTSSGP
jgi:RNA polymerase sigma-70 factor (ECF subfamily)